MMLFLLKALSYALGSLPMGMALAFGKALGRVFFRLDRRHREVALGNLDLAYGESLSPGEKEEIARKVFENLGTTLLEFARIPWLTPGDLKGYVECEGLDNLRAALGHGKGIILLTAHLGNWELLAAFYGLRGFPIDIVVRDVENPTTDRFVRWVRTRFGHKTVPKGRAMRRLLKALSANGIVGILLDQNVTRSEGVFVDFFGVPACTNKGLALLALSSGAAVVPTFIYRAGPGTHRVVIGKEMKLIRRGNRERDVLENTAAFTKAIEEMIRKHPDQWFWVHRRWKTRPE